MNEQSIMAQEREANKKQKELLEQLAWSRRGAEEAAQSQMDYD
jgi:hypothetical protein